MGQLAEEFHTWTNTAGKQVEAALQSPWMPPHDGEDQNEGRRIVVPIASLSPADFEYAKTRYAAMQAAPATRRRNARDHSGHATSRSGARTCERQGQSCGRRRPQQACTTASRFHGPACRQVQGTCAQ